MARMPAAEALAIVAKAREEGRRADLRYANLRYANLGGADLRYANLRYANLGGANLRGADLGGADLGGADLGGANLGYANLGYANLGYANLGYANLGGAAGGGGVCLSLQGLPSGAATLYPTRDGWRLVVGCWEATPDALEALIATDEGWPESTGSECAVRRPGLALLVALCRDHITRHPDTIRELAGRWPATEEVS